MKKGGKGTVSYRVGKRDAAEVECAIRTGRAKSKNKIVKKHTQKHKQ